MYSPFSNTPKGQRSLLAALEAAYLKTTKREEGEIFCHQR